MTADPTTGLPFSHAYPGGALGVLIVFLDPTGAGIPAGVLLAKARNITWPVTAFMYFISDVILAVVFEPMMRVFAALGRRAAFFQRMAAAMRSSVEKASALYGSSGGPVPLILISFGVDPMTGRAAAAAAGHHVLSAWTFAIIGDMMYFAVIMACTLWLRSVFGDGTGATIAILVLMIGVPWAIKRWKERRAGLAAASSPAL